MRVTMFEPCRTIGVSLVLAASLTSAFAGAQPAADEPDAEPAAAEATVPADDGDPDATAFPEPGSAEAAPADAPPAEPRAGKRAAQAAAQTPPQVQRKPAKQPPWEKEPAVELRGQLRALYELTDLPEQSMHQFAVRSARLELRWRHGKLLEAAVEGEFAQEESAQSASSALRDAFVRVKPLRELRLRMGQFKRPFSRLELEARRSLRLVNRGVGNEWIVEDLGYGDRDLGLQLEGRFGKKTGLSYAVGVFNGSGRNRDDVDLDGSKDWVARLEVEPTRWLSVGLSGSYKWFDDEARPSYPRSALMSGADIQIHVGRLRVLGEGMYGENYLYVDRVYSWDALLLASYKVPLVPTWRLALEPVVKGEILMIQHDLREGHVLMGTAGANLHVGRHFRLMMQGELIRHGRRMPEPWEEERRLLVQAAMSTR